MEMKKATVLKDRYRLRRLLGRGGMAAVWEAHDRVLDRPVAVKVLSDAIAADREFVLRFRREATVAAALSHPNLVRVYDYAEAGERPYLVMELVPGEDLGRLIAREEPVEREGLARQLLAALAHIHRAGIVHRDVKPQNVVIRADGRAKLIDFGIARPRNATALTSTGLVLATRSYAAPEVMAGRRASERSDLYSCGLLLEACAGRRQPGLEGLVERLTAEPPSERPASAAAALRELDGRAGPPAQAAPLEPTRAFRPVFEEPAAAEPTEEWEPVRAGDPRGGPRWAVALGLLASVAAVAVVLAAALGGGGGGGDAGGGGSKALGRATDGARGAAGKGAEPVSPTSREGTPPSTVVATPAGADPAGAAALNERGYELIQAGRYEEAVPVLEESVRAFPPGTEDLNYAYALFNLADSLLHSGRPEAAIPLLERRLRIPNQTEVVRRTLEEARGQTRRG